MSAPADFSDVLRMLKNCAPGHEVRLATHSRVISFNGKVYRSMPKFKSIELGHLAK